MKKISRGEQIKNLKSKKSALLKQRDLSMKNRRMSAQQAAEQEYIYVLAPVYSNYSSTPVSYNRVKAKKKRPIIVTVYER